MLSCEFCEIAFAEHLQTTAFGADTAHPLLNGQYCLHSQKA